MSDFKDAGASLGCHVEPECGPCMIECDLGCVPIEGCVPD
jgi:hypothetical protein